MELKTEPCFCTPVAVVSEGARKNYRASRTHSQVPGTACTYMQAASGGSQGSLAFLPSGSAATVAAATEWSCTPWMGATLPGTASHTCRWMLSLGGVYCILCYRAHLTCNERNQPTSMQQQHRSRPRVVRSPHAPDFTLHPPLPLSCLRCSWRRSRACSRPQWG